ncbi:MAG: phospholipid/cholesterol/gamma-HCH transport system substrate-binding protein [Solirubrobacteraceae bacterium]|jgi:virulence factor Mce-like protein|nr:phospholipid/cholesterol/gamma-HCH transport system substrate-binding protein [Solirubrobacteraceae bacterium]
MHAERLGLKIATLVGFVLICAVTFVYLYTKAGGSLRLHGPYEASALVPDSFNIVQNSDVRREGVYVGRVRDIEPAQGVSKITFEIDKPDYVTLYKDATVRVRTKTLVGESYLEVAPGDPATGKLPDKSTIPLSSADESVALERILSTFDAKTREQVQRTIAGFSGGLEDNGAYLNRLFGALQPTAADGGRLMQVLEPQKAQVAALIDNTGTVLGAFGERSEALRGFARDAKATAEAAASRDDQLRATIREIPATLDQARETVNRLADFSGRAAPVVADLKNASVDLLPAIRDLQPAAHDGRTLFRELGPFLNAVNPLLDKLPPATNSLRTVVGPLDAVLRQASPAVNFLKAYKMQIATFFSNVGALTDSRDALGARGRVFALGGPATIAAIDPKYKALADAFLGTGAFEALTGTHFNAYPTAPQLEDPGPMVGTYPVVRAKKKHKTR